MTDAIGVPFGSYRLLRRLAKGGMAEVFLARQTGLEGFDRLVAVKRILPHLVANPEFVSMFLDEARLAAQLRNPNVVHIYDFGKVGEHYFIAMEFVDGITAGELIEHASKSAPLPFELVARIGADACAGLDHAHNLKDMKGRPLEVVHRDVSPPNLLLSFEGAVKLVDFGIAKAQSCVEGTRPGVVKGKVAYMSPEQTQGMSLDGSSDVFSLGLVLWEMLAGRPATSRSDRTEAMRTIRDGKLTPIEVFRPDIPKPLAAALDRALAPYPHERATALELGLALERYLKSTGGISHLELAQWIRTHFAQTALVTAEPNATRQATVATRHATALAGQAAATTVSPPLFPSQTEIAVSVDVPTVRPSRRGPIAVGAVVSLGIVALVLGLTRGGDVREPETAAAPIAAGTPTSESNAAPNPPPIVDALPVTASLEVVSTPPGASVTVGDRAAAKSPVKLEGLEPGTYAVTIELAAHDTVVREVALGRGERRTIELALAPAAVKSKPRRVEKQRPPPPRLNGKLTVRTVPYSIVYFKGRKLGTTPLANLRLPVGKHRLTFVNRDESIKTVRRVVIRPNKTTRLSLKLR